jgi:ElaB/YqjD/DUF883 family membrane-anchored ribosome-binding protein
MTTKTIEGRLLDKDFEDQINANINEAQKYMQKKQSMIEDAVSEHPFEFVIGAFLGGVLIGALLSKKG